MGVLSLLGLANTEVRFWTKSPIESSSGKIAWIGGSAALVGVFLVMAVRERRNEAARSGLDEDGGKGADASSSSDDWMT